MRDARCELRDKEIGRLRDLFAQGPGPKSPVPDHTTGWGWTSYWLGCGGSEQAKQVGAQISGRGEKGGGLVEMAEAGEVDLVHHRRVGQLWGEEGVEAA